MDYIFGWPTGTWTIWSVIFRRRGRRFLLREFVETLPRMNGNNRSLRAADVHQACRDEIKQGVESIIPFLEQQSMTLKATVR